MAQFQGNSLPAPWGSSLLLHSKVMTALACLERLDDQNEGDPRTRLSLSELDRDTGINERFGTKDEIHVGTYPALVVVGCSEKICKKHQRKCAFIEIEYTKTFTSTSQKRNSSLRIGFAGVIATYWCVP